jgi:phenylalanyl-tRNA synthetase alpha subunit
MQKQGQGQKPQQNGQPGMSEQLARMAAEQAAIRRMMEEYQEELKKEGYGNSKELDQLMKDMEKTETELVNKMVTQQMIERQKEILTRLLKHEKAEMEREREEKRESREAKDYIYSNPNEFLEYNRMKDNETELLKTIPPNLTPFYKNKVNEYFFNFEVR